MYVTAEMIRDIERRFGTPVEISRRYEMTAEQLAVVRLGTRHGRCHDVTLVIVEGRNAVVTKKPSYPDGAYRTPSGGIEPGEPFEAGAKREAKEETGLEIELERYLIRANVEFRRLGFHPDRSRPNDQRLEGERGRDGVPTYETSDVILWTSHVLQARPIGGMLQPIDTREIVEARWATFDEIRGPIRQALLDSGSPGLRYRAELDGLAVELLNESKMFSLEKYKAEILCHEDGSSRDINFDHFEWDGALAVIGSLLREASSSSATDGKGDELDPRKITADEICTRARDHSFCRVVLCDVSELFRCLQIFVCEDNADRSAFVELTFFPEDVLPSFSVRRLVTLLSHLAFMGKANDFFVRYENASWKFGSTGMGSGVIFTWQDIRNTA